MNFHDFILSDIEEKKNFLSTLPQNTKPRRKKYMDTIGEMMQIYNGHKEMLANYMKGKKAYLSQDMRNKKIDAYTAKIIFENKE